MDLLEARHILADLLAEKLSLTPDRTLFLNTLPPGAQEGLTLAITGIQPGTPENAAEITAEITGTFESENDLCSYLAQLQDLFRQPCPAGFLFWQISGTVKLGVLPGETMDRNTFQLTAVIALV